MPRPVDQAMKKERPEKDQLRTEWIKLVAEANEEQATNKRYPLYLTLSGAEGLDIKKLFGVGVLHRTENGGVDQDEFWKVVAIESNKEAHAKIQQVIPGLRVKNGDLNSLLNGDTPIRYPRGDIQDAFCAAVINIDLNSPLHLANQETYTEVAWIKKIAILQGVGERKSWKLCLTLNAKLDQSTLKPLQAVLADNFRNCHVFAKRSCNYLGKSLFQKIFDNDPDLIRNKDDLQAALLLGMPKLLAQTLMPLGWIPEMSLAGRYGDSSSGQALMVTWIFSFREIRSVSYPVEYVKYVSEIPLVLAEKEIKWMDGAAAQE